MAHRHRWMRSALCTLIGIIVTIVLLTVPVASALAAPRPHPAPPTHPLARLLLPSEHSVGDLPMLPANPPGNFPFQTATSADGLLVLHTYNQPATFAQQLLVVAQNALRHPVQDTLGLSPTRPVNIYVYGSRDDFLAGAPVGNAEETAALTDPITNSIYIVIDSPQDAGATGTLPHELTHAVFHENVDAGSVQSDYFPAFFPLWLDEGMAAYDEPADSRQVNDYNTALLGAVASKSLVNLLHDFTTTYPQDPATDFLAYAEARSFIGYLVTTYGQAAFHAFVAGAHDGNFLLDAETNFGADLPMLMSRWQASLGATPDNPVQGYVPAPVTTIAYKPGALPALTTRAQPFPFDLGAGVSAPFLIVLGLLTALGLSLLGDEWMAGRGKRWRGIILAIPAHAGRPDATVTPPASLTDVQPAAAPLLAAEGNVQPTAAPQPVVAVASLPSRSRSAVNTRLRWFDVPFVLLPLPFSLAAGYLALRLSPLHEWHTAYLVVACAALPWALASLWLLLRLVRAHGLPVFRLIGLLIPSILIVLPLHQAAAVGYIQARGYETHGAYALALRLYADSGESSADYTADALRVHTEWARAAANVADNATATAQYRAAIALDPSGARTATQRAALVAVTLTWGNALVGSGHFAQALARYTAEAATYGCDTPCRDKMRQQASVAYLTWGNSLLSSGDPTGALAKFSTLATSYAGTPAAVTASAAIPEITAQQALKGALSVGANGDTTGMNAQLASLRSAYPTTAAAALAGETPQLVTGTIRDASGASLNGKRLFLVAFVSRSQASTFDYNFAHDTSAFTVATTIGAGGAFSVRLQPGYWYITCWEDPSQPQYQNLNIPEVVGNQAFTVQPLQPATAGTIVGY